MKKLIKSIYIIIFMCILVILVLPLGQTYLKFRNAPVIPNIISMIISGIFIFILLKINKNITDKKYKIILIILGIVTFILQVIILKYTCFYTDWDVKAVRDIIANNNVKGNFYLTKYPNTLLYFAFLKGYKALPIIGKHYFPLLMFNALLVNLSGIVASLTIRRFTDNFKAIIGYVLLMILTLLNPWINVPYSDTLVILIPISIIYIYTKKEKDTVDYFLIGALSILGYYIKPTAFIVFIGIIILCIIDLFTKKIKLDKKIIILVIVGMIFSYSLVKISIKLTGFEPMEGKESYSMIHYLKMGQNNESYGLYNSTDVIESDEKGKKYDVEQTVKRIKERKVLGQFKFYRVKTLLNFNDGTFAWGREGSLFYYKIIAKEGKISTLLKNYFYRDYKYNDIFRFITQLFWILVLMLTLFAGIKDRNDRNSIIYLSLIGISLFLTIFECRARYLYCYSPIFVTAAMIGYNNLKEFKFPKKKKRKGRKK